jgi:hypothetical protein
MTVYVDDAFIPFYRGMKMCHLLADSDDELHAIAAAIGMRREWHQNGMSGSHYDVGVGKRTLALQNGAVPITVRQAAMMTRHRRKTGVLGPPDPYYGKDYDPSKPRPVESVGA